MSEEEGRAEGGTAGARMEGLPVQAFQMEELLLMVCLQKWRECVQESRKQQKKTDVSHFFLFMSKTRKHFLNLISCNLHRLAVLMTLFLLKCFNLELTLFNFTLFSAFVVKNKIQIVAAPESHTLTVYVVMCHMFDQVLGLFVG